MGNECKITCVMHYLDSVICKNVGFSWMPPLIRFDLMFYKCCRECYSMGHQAQGRRCLLGRSLITQSVPLSGCLDQNWCKSLLEKEQEWLENCSSWPGNIKTCSSNVALYSTTATQLCEIHLSIM